MRVSAVPIVALLALSFAAGCAGRHKPPKTEAKPAIAPDAKY